MGLQETINQFNRSTNFEQTAAKCSGASFELQVKSSGYILLLLNQVSDKQK